MGHGHAVGVISGVAKTVILQMIIINGYFEGIMASDMYVSPSWIMVSETQQGQGLSPSFGSVTAGVEVSDRSSDRGEEAEQLESI